MGAALVVLEAARNVACAGARPLALVNCLNFGNPEHPEVMWQFSEVVDGMAEACRELEIPVVGGNVSFYNESGGADIDPTPVVGVVGLLDQLRGSVPGARLAPGERILLLGATAAELGGSEWAARHGLQDGPPPAADLEAGFRLHPLVADLVAERVVAGAHDCSDGGLAVALAEMAITGGCGFAVSCAGDLEELPPAAVCFSESANRVVLAVAAEPPGRGLRPGPGRRCALRRARCGRWRPPGPGRLLRRVPRRRGVSLARRPAVRPGRRGGRRYRRLRRGRLRSSSSSSSSGTHRSPRPVPRARSGL